MAERCCGCSGTVARLPTIRTSTPRIQKRRCRTSGPRACETYSRWRQRLGEDAIYLAENGESIDRLLRVQAGSDHGWTFDHLNREHRGLLFFGPPGIAPVGTAIASGGAFPPDRQGNLYLGAYGRPFIQGPADVGKEIWEIQLKPDGTVAEPPTVFVKYVGDGYATITGVAYLPDGLYFVDFFNDHPARRQPGRSGCSSVARGA